MLSLLFKKWKNKLLDFFLPKHCIICNAEGTNICKICLESFSRAPKSAMGNIPVFSCFHYTSHTSKIVWEAKYNNKPEIAYIMARYILYCFEEEVLKGDYLIPISIDYSKQIKRKYNVPNLICLLLKQKTKIRIFDKLHKNKTNSQVGLSRKERFINVKNSINLKNGFKLKGKSVIIIDDVITTGATMSAAIKEVLKFNPKKISIITFATRYY